MVKLQVSLPARCSTVMWRHRRSRFDQDVLRVTAIGCDLDLARSAVSTSGRCLARPAFGVGGPVPWSARSSRRQKRSARGALANRVRGEALILSGEGPLPVVNIIKDRLAS